MDIILPYTDERRRKHWSYQGQDHDPRVNHPHPRVSGPLCKTSSIQWATTSVSNPTIMQSAMEYPYTIIFRIGMMYSLFITFLELLFIKWWINSFPFSKYTNFMVFFGAVGLAAYGLFVSCIDRKRINYKLAADAVTGSAVTMSISISIIMFNLTSNRSRGVALANEKSWFLKRLFSFIFGVSILCGLLMYTG